MIFLRKLWWGNYSLIKTYWFFNLLASIPIGILFGLALSIPEERPGTFYISDFLLSKSKFAILFLIFSYTFIGLVGLWRSSNKYTGPTIWRWFAKFVSLLGALTLIGAVILTFDLTLSTKSSYKIYIVIVLLGILVMALNNDGEKPEDDNLFAPAKSGKTLESFDSSQDEHLLWAQALNEFEHSINKGLWAKCFADANGDENIAKAEYLKTRVKELIEKL